MNPWESKEGRKVSLLLGKPGAWPIGGAENRDAAIRWLCERGDIALAFKGTQVMFVSGETQPIRKEGRTLDHALIRLVLAVEKVEKEQRDAK